MNLKHSENKIILISNDADYMNMLIMLFFYLNEKKHKFLNVFMVQAFKFTKIVNSFVIIDIMCQKNIVEVVRTNDFLNLFHHRVPSSPD